MEWPYTIPEDLRIALEEADHDAWRKPLDEWLSLHGIRAALSEFEREVTALDQFRNLPKEQDRWAAIRECLVRAGAVVPSNLPRKPEVPRSEFGH